MKSSLFVAAAAVAVLVSSAAQAEVVGHLGVGAATTDVVVPGPNADFQTYQIEGAAKYDVGSLGALVDGSISGIDGDVDNTNYTATLHLNGKLGNALLGGFGGVDTSDGLTIWSLGVEGQTALTDQITVYGQGGWGDIDDVSGAQLWALRGEVRYFASENFKLQAQAGYLKLDTNVGDADGWSLGGEAEYQFAGTPWSVLAGYDYADSDDLGAKSHTFKIGARYTFGAPSLKARDAAGADLGSVRRLFSGALGL